ncbi:hypothetical protein [Pseudooceanicola aestuarii]|uniref:hypothetical protein n=1 Tax=Pseudooceanicola aestuarii TaxID=2697319 RepID=UPI0013D2F04E|nr:hypothetical protein [Pseudooceanicola aestuarii]
MDILKTATDWTRAEMLSSAFFILFGLGFLLAGAGFWQLARTEVARAYTGPALVAGTLLLIIGVGIFVPSLSRVSGFAVAHGQDAAQFIANETARADSVLTSYRVAVYRVIPLIVAFCALALMVLQAPLWRAGLVTTIAMMAVILLIDTNANARLKAYRDQLAVAAGLAGR